MILLTWGSCCWPPAAKGLERFDAGSVGFVLTITVYTLIDGSVHLGHDGARFVPAGIARMRLD